MNHLVFEYFAVPHVVIGAVFGKYIHCYVRQAHLVCNCTIGTIAYVDGAVLFRGIADEGFSSLERVHVIFKDGHYFVLIEVRYPMEESIQITGRIPVKCLAC
jgi:hypothetical protein